MRAENPRLRAQPGYYTEKRKAPAKLDTSIKVLRECIRLVSLQGWIRRVRQTGIPYIPAVFSSNFPVSAYATLLEKGMAGVKEYTEGEQALLDALQWYRDTLKKKEGGDEKWMARWDCCSGLDVKMYRGHPRTTDWNREAFQTLTLDDPRVMDAMVGETSRIAVRPYVEPYMIRGYPLEFRVYGDSAWVTGVSNYYPQRDLHPYDRVGSIGVADYMTHAFSITEKFYHLMRMPYGLSADYLVTKDGELLYLEGGPPHVPGASVSAHPCCFLDGDCRGAALTDRRKEGE